MATRSEIGVYEHADQRLDSPDVILYKHWDGYPDSTVPLCMQAMNRIIEVGVHNNPAYVRAQMIYFIMWAVYAESENLRTTNDHVFKDMSAVQKIRYAMENYCLGDGKNFGINTVFGAQSDATFYYAIYPDRLECYRYDDWNEPILAYALMEQPGGLDYVSDNYNPKPDNFKKRFSCTIDNYATDITYKISDFLIR